MMGTNKEEGDKQGGKEVREEAKEAGNGFYAVGGGAESPSDL